MALVKFGGIVAEARGKEAGVIYSRNAYGSYVKQKVSPVNPQTSLQLAQRTQMGNTSQLWAGLSAGEKASWDNLGSQVTRVNRFGDTTYYTGFGIFMKLNRNILICGGTQLDSAPALEVAASLTFTSVTIASGTPSISLAFTPTVPSTTSMVVYATNNILTGRRFVKNYYRKIAVIGAAATSPQTLYTQWLAVFGNLLVTGATIYFKIKFIRTNTGFENVPSQGSGVVGA